MGVWVSVWVSVWASLMDERRYLLCYTLQSDLTVTFSSTLDTARGPLPSHSLLIFDFIGIRLFPVLFILLIVVVLAAVFIVT